MCAPAALGEESIALNWTARSRRSGYPSSTRGEAVVENSALFWVGSPQWRRARLNLANQAPGACAKRARLGGAFYGCARSRKGLGDGDGSADRASVLPPLEPAVRGLDLERRNLDLKPCSARAPAPPDGAPPLARSTELLRPRLPIVERRALRLILARPAIFRHALARHDQPSLAGGTATNG